MVIGRRRAAHDASRSCGLLLLGIALLGLTVVNYFIATTHFIESPRVVAKVHGSRHPNRHKHPAVTVAPQVEVVVTPAPTVNLELLQHPEWFVTDPPDTEVNHTTYENALTLYQTLIATPYNLTGLQETDSFIDIPDAGGHGVLLPYDSSDEKKTALWRHCDPRNATFTIARDDLCAQYLRDPNNMRSIKALPAYLKNGRTIKFKIIYHHGNLTAIVKVSQNKFFYEATSEYLSYSIDRALNFSRVPPTVYMPLPLDFMRAASAIVSGLYSHWFEKFIIQYDYTKDMFIEIDGKQQSLVSIQLWMHDVHSALDSYLAVDYELDDYFLHKFFDPEDRHPWPPRPHRLTAIGDLCDRFIFDFIIGNTDRGLNDHNNFVYGGCNDRTACAPPKEPWKRTIGPAKYAFLDHGSSFYTHKEPEGNPFTGNETTRPIICRFRRSTYDSMLHFARKEEDITNHRRPLVAAAEERFPEGHKLFETVHRSVFKTVQDRIEKVLHHARDCVERFGEDHVFVL